MRLVSGVGGDVGVLVSGVADIGGVLVGGGDVGVVIVGVGGSPSTVDFL